MRFPTRSCLLLLAAGLCASATVAATNVYQWKDAQGVTHYLLNPVTVASLRAKLVQYAQWRAHLAGVTGGIAQTDVDRLFELRRAATAPSGPPKGLSDETLAEVTARLREAATPQSASEVGDAVGTSRVTARRYLEHLVEQGVATRQTRHGQTGRPEVLYHWA